MNCGMINPIKKATKILMHDGQQKTVRNFMDIKITQKLTIKANSLRNTQ